MQILIFILCVISLSFPIIIWAYIFSYLDQQKIERRRFIWGIFFGAGALLPLLYLEKITAYISLLDVLTFFSSAESFMDFGIGFVVFLLFISILFFYSLLFSFHHFLRSIEKYLYCFLSVVLLIVTVTLLLFSFSFLYKSSSFLQSLQVFDFPSFQSVWFDTAFLIILYYFIVATIEEVSKYFMSLQNQSLERKNTLQYALLGALFVALGFAFIENIFYTYRFLSGGFSGVFGVMIFRSIFSTLLHVICTVTFFSGSIYLLSGGTKKRRIPILNSALFGLLAVSFHTFYNMSLAYGYLGVVIIAIIGGYFYLSYLFTRN